ncbi:MAG: hypothetical protein HXY40_11725 [Chloroflexi bacterium]|nr:hypothetical protein [Chloroflexota bacterium]
MPIRERLALHFFGQMLVLLLLYASTALLSAVKFIGLDPLETALPYQQISAFSHVLLQAGLLTGFIGVGLALAARANLPVLRWLAHGWTLLLALTFAAGAFGLLEGRHMLELPPLLDIIQAALIIAVIAALLSHPQNRATPFFLWALALAICALAPLVPLLPPADPLRDQALSSLVVSLIFYLAYALAAAAICAWLVPSSANRLLLNAGLLAFTGVLLSLAALNTVAADDFSRGLALIGALLAPLAYLCWLSAGPVADRWTQLALFAFLLSNGLLGALLAVPAISQWTQGTRLNEAHLTLTALAALSLLLGVALKTRSANYKNSLLAFWVFLAGLVLSSLALIAAGLVQTYLERILTIGYLDTQNFLLPLYIFWVIGLLILALAITLFAFNFVRRQKI